MQAMAASGLQFIFVRRMLFLAGLSAKRMNLFFPALREIAAFTAHMHPRAGGKCAYQKN